MPISIALQLPFQVPHEVLPPRFLFSLELCPQLEHTSLLIVRSLVDDAVLEHVLLVLPDLQLFIQLVICAHVLLMFVPDALEFGLPLPLLLFSLLRLHLRHRHIDYLLGSLLLSLNFLVLLRIAHELFLLSFLLLHLLNVELVVVIVWHKLIFDFGFLDQVQ